jgi:hypothetical protein
MGILTKYDHIEPIYQPQSVVTYLFTLCITYKYIRTPLKTAYTKFNWFFLLGPAHILGEFENWMKRRISGPKREEVRGGWRKLHNEEFSNL